MHFFSKFKEVYLLRYTVRQRVNATRHCNQINIFIIINKCLVDSICLKFLWAEEYLDSINEPYGEKLLGT